MKNLMIKEVGIEELSNLIKNILNKELSKIETPPKETKYISRKEAASILNVTLPTLNDYVKRGLVPAYRIGSRVLFKRKEVENSPQIRRFK